MSTQAGSPGSSSGMTVGIGTASPNPTVQALKGIRLLKGFSDSELADIIKLGSSTIYEPHTNIVIEGELSWGLYIILDGMVGIFKTNKLTGQSYDIGSLRSGSSFGEMSLVDENPRSATVRALTETAAFFIPKDNFTSFIDQSSDLKVKFFSSCVKTLVLMLRELDDNYVISQYQLWQSALRKQGDSR